MASDLDVLTLIQLFTAIFYGTSVHHAAMYGGNPADADFSNVFKLEKTVSSAALCDAVGQGKEGCQKEHRQMCIHSE